MPLGQHWTYHHLSDSWREEERLRGWVPTDQELQEMVEDNIEADPLLRGRDRRSIQVRAAGGVVTLTGTVRGRLAKFAAGSDAYWTFGVNEVRNELAIKPRGPQYAGQVAPVGLEPPATGGDSADSGAPAFLPPRTSPHAEPPTTGRVDEPGSGVDIEPRAAEVAELPEGE